MFFSEEILDLTEPVNALIDITDSQLDDQLLELEKLTMIDSNNSQSTSSASTSGDNLLELLDSSVEHDKLFSDLLSPISPLNITTNDKNTFDADWSAAFGASTAQQSSQIPTMINRKNSTTSTNDFLPSSLLNERLSSTQKSTPSTSAMKNPSNWLDLFAELDPIQNPDAIGKSSRDEFDRNC